MIKGKKNGSGKKRKRGADSDDDEDDDEDEEEDDAGDGSEHRDVDLGDSQVVDHIREGEVRVFDTRLRVGSFNHV